MSSSVPVPAAEMTQSPHPQPGEPAAGTADPAEPAGRAPGLIRRARTAARPASSTGALIAVIVLLATGLGAFVLRDLDSLEADIDTIETDIDNLNTAVAQMDARFVKLKMDMDDGFAEVDARFVKLEKDMDDGFAEVDARFDQLEAGQQEIALTLTALVAYLRADEGVDAALAGRVLDPAAGAGSSTDSG